MIDRRRILAGFAVVAAGPLAPAALLAQMNPVTIVVPYAPGGTTDMLGRLLAKELAPLLGRSIVVDNRPGAGSGIGAALVAKSAPDGSTLLVATSTTLAINPSLYKKLSYDPARDFAPIGLIGSVPLVAVVNAAVPVKSIAELVTVSKSRPQGLPYGSAGNGSPQHLAVEMFKAATGARLTHVPYKGSSLAVTDLLGGQIDLMFSDIPPALSHVRAGRLRAIAVTSGKRQAAMPEIPTVAESGAEGTREFEAVAWQSLVAPAGTPGPVIAEYSRALVKVMTNAELRSRLEADGFEPRTSSPQELAAYIKSETARWAKVASESGATVD
jgi:tripartite-type tricarboxylate transporter receptor subunit TctC